MKFPGLKHQFPFTLWINHFSIPVLATLKNQVQYTFFNFQFSQFQFLTLTHSSISLIHPFLIYTLNFHQEFVIPSFSSISLSCLMMNFQFKALKFHFKVDLFLTQHLSSCFKNLF